MKATGVVRRIDELGRVVIPREIRKTLHIREGEPMEIYTGNDGEVILRKFSPVGGMGDTVREIADSLAALCNGTAIVCDREKIVYAGGKNRKEWEHASLPEEWDKAFEKRKVHSMGQNIVVCPVIADGDVPGGVVLFTKEGGVIGEIDFKLCEMAATIIGRVLMD